MPVKFTAVLLALLLAFACLHGEAEWVSHANARFGYVLEYPGDWQLESDPASGWFRASLQPDKAAPTTEFSVSVDSLSESMRNMDFYDYMAQDLAQLKRALEARGHRNIRVLSSQAEELNGQTVHRVLLRSAPVGDLYLQTLIVRVRRGSWHFTLSGSAEEGFYYEQAAPFFERMCAGFRFRSQLPDYLKDYVRVRASLDGSEAVFHWQGKAYALVPGEKRRELFDLEGYHIVRAKEEDNGYLLLGREVCLFLDRRTGQLAPSWRNPVSGEDLPVQHFFNDPVNQDLRFTEQDLALLPMILPSAELGDQIAYYSELFPYYPNPLSRKEYPLNAQSNTYQAAEFTQYTARRDALADPTQSGVPALYNFTRILPWLPFIQMG